MMGSSRREVPHAVDNFRADHVACFIGGDQQVERVVLQPVQQRRRSWGEMAKVAVQNKCPADECGVLDVRVDNGDSHDFRRRRAR